MLACARRGDYFPPMSVGSAGVRVIDLETGGTEPTTYVRSAGTNSMITIWGGQTSRSIRAVWLAEEMGLSYCLRQVDILAEEKDPAWLAVNPGDFLPAH